MLCENMSAAQSQVQFYSSCLRQKFFAVQPVVVSMLSGTMAREPKAVLQCQSPPESEGACLHCSMSTGGCTPSVGTGMCPGPFTCVTLMQNSHLAMLEILFKRTVCILIQSIQTLLTRSVSRRISRHVKASHVNKAPRESH